MFWYMVENIYEWIISILMTIDKDGYPIFISILLMYVFLLVCMLIMLAMYDGVIITGLSRLLDFFYKFSIKNRSVSTVRLLSEWYYLIDKFLHVISPHVFSYRLPSNNVLDKSDIFSPIVLYRFAKSFVLSMFTISLSNVVIWGVIISYFYPTAIPTSFHWVKDLSWDELYSTITQIEYKKISDIISFSMLATSIIILLWLSSSSFKWQAMKKVNEEKYEKAIKYQETLENELGEISYKSKNNIDKLNWMIEFLPNKFGEIITQTEMYSLEKNEKNDLQLKSHGTKRTFTSTKLEDLTSGYESFQDNLNNVNRILNDMYESNVRFIYNRVNKSVRYESLQLGLITKAHLHWDLIEGEYFRKTIEERLKGLSYVSDLFKKINDINRGWLSKEEFVNEYNKHGDTITFESIVEYLETELEEELLGFKRFLHEELENAIFHHIVLEQYLELSHRNTRFNFLQTISNFITK
ncbi:hypothetical protein ABEX25_14700 [Paenibacillus thiaminolyticus]|uniref:hypothetical protein n=1 Tax=Paenibacillus thiaminolyticus TaxID=49283 RepID=UPI003D273E22